jgi:hypothetical protein
MTKNKEIKMTFATYINQAWTDHATQSEKVAKEFATAASLVETNDQLAQLVGIVTHVMGEHLGRWDEGIKTLKALEKNSKFLTGTETEKTILRSIEVLKIGSGQGPDLNSFTISDRIRIMAVAASALSERDTARAIELFSKSLDLSKTGLDRKDAANRALAVTGNNLACALEEKRNRSQGEIELMILASQTGRKYWELVGTWLEISRAEYRLAMTFLQANDLAKALQHAQTCVELCQENKAGDMDMFYSYEVLATVERARCNDVGFQKALDKAKHYFETLNPEDKTWCEASLKKLL